MKKIQVETPGGAYPIFIGEGSSDRLAPWVGREVRPSSIHLVSDTSVYGHHGDRVLRQLRQLGVPLSQTVVPAGERSKSTRQLERIWRGAIASGLDRRGLVIALGGGVVGDLAGMAAATILRGIDLVQVPTSLLAMVDSSVGGKTGINLPEGKNLVGAFHQPRAVFADLNFLRTLPRRELRAGWAEIIKAAAIRDARLMGRLEKNASDLARARPRGLETVIATACRIKAAVVQEDEREAGLRMILNFGHTLAHGLEAASGYGGSLLHGEAVAIGMHFASRLGLALGHGRPEVVPRLAALLKTYGLPVTPSGVSEAGGRPPGARKVLGAMSRDKKKGPGGLRWVFVPRVGETVIVEDVPPELVESSVKAFLKE